MTTPRRNPCFPMFVRVLALACASAAMLPHAAIADPTQLLERTSRSSRYVAASPQELVQCRVLFERVMRQPDDPELRSAWRELGFEYTAARGREPGCWMVYERPAESRGWGFFLVCPERLTGATGHQPLVLQAPHSFSDRFTRNVALRLLKDGDFAAAAWNTVHRDVVDVAHTTDHPFQAFTQAIIAARSDSFVIQVHGFAQSNRKSARGATTDLIVSNGDDYPDPWVRKLAVLLQSEPALGRVHLFPTQINELGATTNVQGQMLRQAGSQRFLHLEMSHDLRVRLVADPRVRAALLKNLLAAVE